MKRKITILGATGSIGRQTLEVIQLHPDLFQVFALSANHSVSGMLSLCLTWKPIYAVMQDEKAAERLSQQLFSHGAETTVLSGQEGLCFIASHPDVEVVMASIVGGAGLPSSLAAASSGKTILLANKESLVMAGSLFLSAAKQSGATIIPVDSEHNAIFQCWKDTHHAGHERLSRIYLTASGGPFLRYPAEALANVTPEQAVKHPRWNMGPKISVDCATMANKGLEVIEAHFLFDLPYEQLGVLIHPQSTVHALAEYIDGSVLAHLGEHDMRVAISYALGWPDRIASGINATHLFGQMLSLQFEPLKTGQFPCYDLAMQALQAGQADVIIFNAANEVAVQAFLDKQLAFTDIPVLIEKILAQQPRRAIASLVDVVELDKATREQGESSCKLLSAPSLSSLPSQF